MSDETQEKIAALEARIAVLESHVKAPTFIREGGKGRNNTWGICKKCKGTGQISVRHAYTDEVTFSTCSGPDGCNGRGQGPQPR
jgi:hypothetical protein